MSSLQWFLSFSAEVARPFGTLRLIFSASWFLKIAGGSPLTGLQAHFTAKSSSLRMICSYLSLTSSSAGFIFGILEKDFVSPALSISILSMSCRNPACSLNVSSEGIFGGLLRSKRILCRPGAYFMTGAHDATCMAPLHPLFLMWVEGMKEPGLRKYLLHNKALF